MRSKAPYVALAIVLASAAAAYAAIAGIPADGATLGTATAGESSSPLRVSGYVTGLYPGASKSMTVTVRNPLGDPVEVRWVGAKVRDAGPDCRGENLVAQPSRQQVQIEPHGVSGLELEISMRPSAPDVCQGATFPLRFRARALVAGETSAAHAGDGSNRTASTGQGGATSGGLPYTGLVLVALALAAAALLYTGIALRGRTPTTRRRR